MSQPSVFDPLSSTLSDAQRLDIPPSGSVLSGQSQDSRFPSAMEEYSKLLPRGFSQSDASSDGPNLTPGLARALEEYGKLLPRSASETPTRHASGDDGFERFVHGVVSVESGGRYNAIGRPTKYGQALGKYQVLPGNIGPWTQSAIGRPLTPEQFLNDPKAQDATARWKLRQYYNQYGPAGAASAWNSGKPDGWRTMPGVGEYVRSVLGAGGFVHPELQPNRQPRTSILQNAMGDEVPQSHLVLPGRAPLSRAAIQQQQRAFQAARLLEQQAYRLTGKQIPALHILSWMTPWGSEQLPFTMDAYWHMMATNSKMIPTIFGQTNKATAIQMVKRALGDQLALHPVKGSDEPLVQYGPNTTQSALQNQYRKVIPLQGGTYHIENTIPLSKKMVQDSSNAEFEKLPFLRQLGESAGVFTNILGRLPGAVGSMITEKLGEARGAPVGWWDDPKLNPELENQRRLINSLSFLVPGLGEAQAANALAGTAGSALQNGVVKTAKDLGESALDSASGIFNRSKPLSERFSDAFSTAVNLWVLYHGAKFGLDLAKQGGGAIRGMRSDPAAMAQAASDFGVSSKQMGSMLDAAESKAPPPSTTTVSANEFALANGQTFHDYQTRAALDNLSEDIPKSRTELKGASLSEDSTEIRRAEGNLAKLRELRQYGIKGGQAPAWWQQATDLLHRAYLEKIQVPVSNPGSFSEPLPEELHENVQSQRSERLPGEQIRNRPPDAGTADSKGSAPIANIQSADGPGVQTGESGAIAHGNEGQLSQVIDGERSRRGGSADGATSGFAGEPGLDGESHGGNQSVFGGDASAKAGAGESLASEPHGKSWMNTLLKYHEALKSLSVLEDADFASQAGQAMAFDGLEKLFKIATDPRITFKDALTPLPPEIQAKASSFVETVNRSIGEGGFKDLLGTARTGANKLQAALDPNAVEKSAPWELSTRVNKALRTPLQNASFQRSLMERAVGALSGGQDLDAPDVRRQIVQGAYEDSKSSIFENQSGATKSLLDRLDAIEQKTGKQYPTARASIQSLNPSFNVGSRNFDSMFGLAHAPVRAAFDVMFDRMTPEEAEICKRAARRGGVGAGMFMLGYLYPHTLEAIPRPLQNGPLLTMFRIGSTVRLDNDPKKTLGQKMMDAVGEGLTDASGLKPLGDAVTATRHPEYLGSTLSEQALDETGPFSDLAKVWKYTHERENPSATETTSVNAAADHTSRPGHLTITDRAHMTASLLGKDNAGNRLTPLDRKFLGMSWTQAVDAYRALSPKDRQAIAPIIGQKLNSRLTRISPTALNQIAARYPELVQKR